MKNSVKDEEEPAKASKKTKTCKERLTAKELKAQGVEAQKIRDIIEARKSSTSENMLYDEPIGPQPLYGPPESPYAIKYHYDVSVDKNGNRMNNVGHFYVEFSGPETSEDGVFFGQNPKFDGMPISPGDIIDEQKRYDEVKGGKEIITKATYVDKVSFDKAYALAKARSVNPQLYVGHFGADCIDFNQQIYTASGQKGDFVDLFTAAEINQLDTWAGFSASVRYGAGDKFRTVTGASREQVAAKYNVPLERVIESINLCTSSTECVTNTYTIEPVLPKQK